MAGDRNISYILRSLLNSLGLDEDQRQRRKNCQNMNQFLCAFEYSQLHNSTLPLLSGSTYETTTIDGLSSDVDVMIIHGNMRIIADIKDWRRGVPSYLIDNTGCYRAFVKLVLLSSYYPVPVYVDSLPFLPPFHEVDVDGKVLLSKTIINASRADMSKGEMHGPAVTLSSHKTRLETDIVYTLRCDSFPREAAGWKKRQTLATRSRVDPAIIDDINHCYLVAVGNKNSATEHLEWRLSFSHIENKLIHAWNNVQYQCYILMKFIQKDLIKPEVPDGLCSYHYKTLIMWMNEEYPLDFFVSSNFEQCIYMCLKNMVEAVRKGSLPHYFVEGCNLLYKLTKNNEITKKLVAVIQHIVDTWPWCLYNVSRCNLGRMFEACHTRKTPMSRICAGVDERRRRKGYWYELVYENGIVAENYFDAREAALSNRTKILRLSIEFYMMANQSNFNDESKRFIDFFGKDTLCNIALEWIQCKSSLPNKTTLKNIASGLRCIQRFRNSRITIDTGLKIAAHFVMTGNHRLAILLLDKVENQIKPYTDFTCEHSSCVNNFSQSHRLAIYDNKPSFIKLFKHYIGTAVTYDQEKISHVPKGLVYEMFRSISASPVADPGFYDWHSLAVIHCPVYLHYLRFLCHQAQRRNVQQQVALKNMERAAEKLSVFPGTHAESNHNIIGYCHKSEGNTRRAYKEYRKSLEKKKYNNAVLLHLAVLIRDQICKNNR